MKIALDNPAESNAVNGYRPGRVTINGSHYGSSLLVMPGELVSDWEPASATELSGNHLARVVERQVEVLIVGTGERQQFPDPAVFATLMAAGIGFEVMDNAAACRTFNVLLAENRRVALALLFDQPAPVADDAGQ
jgi:uncharacterized protein